ncbi:hypothetical protein HDV00_004759 [Rhizophlyctis rosea]|nr:hypothetical protein HDV00_004759 [Rhizophlyctis rosea]
MRLERTFLILSCVATATQAVSLSPLLKRAVGDACPATPVAAAARLNCWNAQTTPASCVASGCCWSALPPGVVGPNCFANKPKAALCPVVAAAQRIDCAGQVGPNCFYSPEQVPAAPTTQPKDCPADPYPAFARVDCGHANTTPAGCNALGCCWSPLPAGTEGPYCYKTALSASAGPPGSDPGTPLKATVANPGAFNYFVTSPIVPLSVAAIPGTTQVLLIEREAGGKKGTTHTYTLNYATGAFAPLTMKTDMFCVGGSMMSDGRIVAMGGWTGAPSLHGIRVFTAGGDWQDQYDAAHLLVPRWYPSAVLLPSGKIWVLGGATDMQPPGVVQPNAEILPTDGKLYTPPLLALPDFVLYPHAHYIHADTNRNTPSIWLFAGRRSQLLYPENLATLVELPLAPPGSRMYPASAAAVMLPLIADAQNNVPPAQIVICGGSTSEAGAVVDAPALDTCVRTTPSLGTKATWLVEKMPAPRVMGDMVALPDRTYLILNGARIGTSGFNRAARDPIRTALIYNPAAPVGSRFKTVATSPHARLYHSEAILIPDGRVLVMGSTPNYDGNIEVTPLGPIHMNDHVIEAYSPPYLTSGMKRPVIGTVAGTWGYNTLYTITATIPTGVLGNI